MASPPLILHQYDVSPFSQKAQKMMGLKGLSWQSVEMPMIAPKPDVEALTGGYRGTPVLQIGRDVFIDNWMIARALDEFDAAGPAINAQGGLREAALYAWGERLFTPLLHAALAAYQSQWDADFLADRKRVFPDVDFDTLDVSDPDRRSQVRAYLGTVEAQLGLGQDFLGGAQADSWDIHVWGMVWMIHSALPALMPIVETFPRLTDWYERMSALGTGDREDVEIDVAWQALKDGPARPLPDTPGSGASGTMGWRRWLIFLRGQPIAAAHRVVCLRWITSRWCWAWSRYPARLLRCGSPDLATTSSNAPSQAGSVRRFLPNPAGSDTAVQRRSRSQ